jgi:hypothetical protein
MWTNYTFSCFYMYIKFIQQVQCDTRLNIIRGQCAQDEKFYPKSSMYFF